MMPTQAGERLLFSGADWDFGTIQRIYDAVETIADPARLFFNVNSAEDLAVAERMASES